ncbi:MAG: HlyC/CorC family transporter [Clostridia bacterium]|nr:HlyC/CorC family transporter [Clostridia bacterium]
MTGNIILIAILVTMSAYFSATETAFSSLNKTRLKTMAEKGNKRAQKTLSLAENYDKLISTILIGNNIVNIACASISTLLFIDLINEQSGPAISTLVTTVIVLIFGEITPKSIAKDIPERFAMFSTPMISVLIFVLTPVNYLFSQWKKLASKIIKDDEDDKMSSEELMMIVDEVTEDGSLDDDEGDLIKNAIEFAEQEARDILTHRVDLEAVAIDEDKAEIAKLFTKTKLSRLLVYEEDIDNIIGVIHLKDFFTEKGITRKSVKTIMAKPVFVQEYEKINDLLKRLQKNKTHMAVVIDEYGGTLGIVTMEDILEELVGEIWDEYDVVEEDFVEIGENVYDVDGSASFDDFCDFFDIEEESDNVSVGGWVTELLGKLPEVGDEVTFGNLKMVVTDVDSHRVENIEVTCITPEEE